MSRCFNKFGRRSHWQTRHSRDCSRESCCFIWGQCGSKNRIRCGKMNGWWYSRYNGSWRGHWNNIRRRSRNTMVRMMRINSWWKDSRMTQSHLWNRNRFGSQFWRWTNYINCRCRRPCWKLCGCRWSSSGCE